MSLKSVLAVAALALVSSTSASAAEWSDTSISYRVGTRFAEPFNPVDIRKNIFALTHASGYKYGSNFFNVDLLQSDSNDPGSLNQHSGAQEVYAVYRNTLDIGKVRGVDMGMGPVSGFGITGGFDWNSKNDVGYNSRKRMLVLGPTLMWKVPGFLNTSLLVLHESNAPSGAFAPISNVAGRYTYKIHPMLTASWGIPVCERVKFEGYANLIAPKGRDEVGNQTGTETNIDMQLMADVGDYVGAGKNTFRIGVEYQYWNNKFGNTSATTGGKGQRASTPMLRAEYHF
ncbi:outer envelope protein [Massilia sp. R2A-15]|uniref:outer envelope protein n=1 Tax=Massilia sp. R2A-15 TaxID=3064278 RepID=UPI00273634FF|nr:outer envelope protein [Massilia sp. R2A-15]WLI89355.1 outer envelope protein [Massilia sp. R2A-15]